MYSLVNSAKMGLMRSGGTALGNNLIRGAAVSSGSSIYRALGNNLQKRNYHESVIDHFKNPRNVGKLDNKKKNVGEALVGKASCGDVIKLQLEVGDDGKIKDAKFKTFGCGSAIASSSLVTEMIKGMTIEDARAVRNTDISSELKLPPIKIHCSVLAEEAVQAALQNYEQKQAAGGGGT